jgi:uncharacterized protein (UPF0276 family)
VHRQLVRHSDELDFIEICAAPYLSRTQQDLFDRDGSQLAELKLLRCRTFSSDALALGPPEPAEAGTADRLRNLLRQIDASWCTERVELSSASEGEDCEALTRRIVQRYQAVTEILGTPILLEITTSTASRRSFCSEPRVVGRVAGQTDCGLSLDLANLLANARNHNIDPLRFMRELPGSRIIQLRIAGVRKKQGLWLSDPRGPVSDEIFDLLDAVMALTAADTVVIQREGSYFQLANLIAEVDRARHILADHRARIAGHRQFTRQAQTDGLGICTMAEPVQADTSMPGASGHSARAGYIRDYLRQRQLIAWAIRERWQ